MKKTFLFSAFFLVVISLIGANELFVPHALISEAKTITIEPGMGSRKIGEFLKQQGIIRSKWAFVTYVSLRGEASYLQPGEYTFGQEAIPQIVAELLRGGPKDITVVFPEGWTTTDIGTELERRGLSTRQAFTAATVPPRSESFRNTYPFLQGRPVQSGLEGYLFPDTYRFFKDASADQVVAKMLENFNNKLSPELQAGIRASGHSLYQILTMASLIEKEVPTDEDRALVSGILWKRIEQGIPLQVDATILYITQKKTALVSVQDTLIDSPYNTYRYTGLPVGPIANPGMSAIRAALYPKSSPYLFYLSRPDGKTVFSRTFAEHTAAKAQYLK